MERLQSSFPPAPSQEVALACDELDLTEADLEQLLTPTAPADQYPEIDESVWPVLYTKCYRTAYSFLAGKGNPSVGVEDLTMEALLNVSKSPSSRRILATEGLPNLINYACRATRNTGINTYHDDQRLPSDATEDLSELPLSTPSHESQTETRMLLEQLMSLNIFPQGREAFMLVRLYGYSQKEACDQLGIPMGTLLSRIYRYEHALRESPEAKAIRQSIVGEI